MAQNPSDAPVTKPRTATGFVAANPRTAPFVRHHRRYDEWFERHRAAYLSELLAARALLPWSGRGLEIGVGTGRFAAPLGVAFGLDPAAEMLGYARERGIGVVRAVAEALPFARGASPEPKRWHAPGPAHCLRDGPTSPLNGGRQET